MKLFDPASFGALADIKATEAKVVRLKKKSQSVDVASPGFSSFIPSLSINRPSSPVAKTTTIEVQENNTTNSQRRTPRCSELKRGYTIVSRSPMNVPHAGGGLLGILH
ncbi:oxidation resistance protein 1a isoform X2 [Tachysurus ichikawai]